VFGLVHESATFVPIGAYFLEIVQMDAMRNFMRLGHIDKITTREEFTDFVCDLRDDFEEDRWLHGEHLSCYWENTRIEPFLEAMAYWVTHCMDDFYQKRGEGAPVLSWRLFAEMMFAGASYTPPIQGQAEWAQKVAPTGIHATEIDEESISTPDEFVDYVLKLRTDVVEEGLLTNNFDFFVPGPSWGYWENPDLVMFFNTMARYIRQDLDDYFTRHEKPIPEPSWGLFAFTLLLAAMYE
jgi:hypothetical protein